MYGHVASVYKHVANVCMYVTRVYMRCLLCTGVCAWCVLAHVSTGLLRTRLTPHGIPLLSHVGCVCWLPVGEEKDLMIFLRVNRPVQEALPGCSNPRSLLYQSPAVTYSWPHNLFAPGPPAVLHLVFFPSFHPPVNDSLVSYPPAWLSLFRSGSAWVPVEPGDRVVRWGHLAAPHPRAPWQVCPRLLSPSPHTVPAPPRGPRRPGPPIPVSGLRALSPEPEPHAEGAFGWRVLPHLPAVREIPPGSPVSGDSVLSLHLMFYSQVCSC